MESRKMVPKNLFTGQQWRNRHREQTYGDGERGGESEMYEKSSMGTYITMCKIDSQQEISIWGSVSTQRVGWGGRQREAQKGGDICIPIADSY